MNPWYALYVTRDLKAAESLRELGFEVFAPTYQRLTRRSRFKQLEPAPLMPGYVFVRIGEREFAAAMACEHVVYVLSADGVPRAIPEEIIAGVMRMVESGRLDEQLPAQKTRARGIRGRGLQSLIAWFEITGQSIKQAA